MNICEVCKADPITVEIEIPDTEIMIVHRLPKHKDLKECEAFFEAEADMIEEALYESLPQGTYDRLIVKFMKRKVSLYHGITC